MSIPAFYTHVSCHNDAIIHRYIDTNGNPHIEKVSNHEFEYFMPNPNGDVLSLLGRKLSRKVITSTNDVRKVFKEYKDIGIHGYDKADIQFITNTYKGDITFDLSKIKIANIDIETAIGTGFPIPNKAEQEIISITVGTLGTNKTITWTSLNYDENLDTGANRSNIVIRVANEVELFNQFLDWWFKEKFEAVTGWNIKGFDIPYIINRGKKVLGEKSMRMLSPIANLITRGIMYDPNPATGNDEYKIDGLSTLDYIELYKKYSFTPQPNYKLETICQHEINEGKVDYCGYSTLKEFYENNPTMFIRYNIQDVLLVNKLDDKLKYIMLSYTLQYLAKCNTNDIFGQVKFWDCLLYAHLKERGIVIPPASDNPEMQIEGAYVAEPKLGKHKWVISFDLTSLYPMIIKQYNMSPETIRLTASEENLIEELINLETPDRLKQAFEQRLAMSANGAMFSKEQKGMFAEVIDKLFNIRKETRNKMKDIQRRVANGELDKRALDEVDALDAIQMAMKIAINSLYGACGNKGFRYYDHNIAEGITKSGQLSVRYIGKRLNEFLSSKLGEADRWVYTDTDSVYFTLEDFVNAIDPKGQVDKYTMLKIVDKFIVDEIEPFINQCYEELAKHMNAFENAMSMKRETISLSGMWRAKKNYVILELDNEGVLRNPPKLKEVGTETVRSTTPEFVKQAIRECYEILLTQDGKNILLDKIADFKESYFKQEYKTIATPRGVNDMTKWVDKDGNYITRIPYHVKASHEYNRLREVYKLYDLPIISDGSKINLIQIRETGKVTGGYIAYVDDIPEEFDIINDVDYDTMFEKTFVSPVNSFASLMNVKTENSIDLTDLFS